MRTRHTILDDTIQYIKEYITSGKVKPGDKMLTETEICEQTGNSRSTVREAVKMLQAMGYIEVKHGRGTFVKTTELKANEVNSLEWFMKNQAEVSEMLELRKLIEPLAARLAAERITPMQLETLKDVLEHYSEAEEKNDISARVLYENAFHALIFKAAGNRVFSKIYDSMSDFLNGYFASTTIDRSKYPVFRPSCEHRRVYNAIADRNAKEAERAMAMHIGTTVELSEMLIKQTVINE